ncbi:putative 3-oxoacyl-(acyl carrier protein) reductase (plasmid) [Scytonema sp. HK-05]|uniref:SDR family NAD(P)-dependent oxidoreductase n=1 Tax=Scytonema sp. HK-05 TaxID=1137095 RepID=UPI00093637D3|nr:SDR family oxidoreductase [Scytonema sp. HK-05]OKH59407.1 short-chain dehydrogenase [Scytonema sp. HK-05]BAY50075.1 putative 3-oxoacyl-(acyl carrier protein) reductase [Scytonema sp. HK-05]
MDLHLRDKRALITGSSSGIGAAIAKALAQEGAIVIVHGRKQEQANRMAQEISADGNKAFVAVGDISTDEGARQVVDKVLSSLGGVDILVNNAGIYEDRGWMDSPPNGWAEIYNANVISMVRMIQLLIPHMKQLGWGRIIQIASGLAIQPFAARPDYQATKAATLNMTVSLAKELAQTGITVNTVSPGLIATEGAKRIFHQIALTKGWGTEWAEIEKHLVLEDWPNPSSRLGRPEEVANIIAYLASPLADYINGANIRVDGGGVGAIN